MFHVPQLLRPRCGCCGWWDAGEMSGLLTFHKIVQTQTSHQGGGSETSFKPSARDRPYQVCSSSYTWPFLGLVRVMHAFVCSTQ
jgi:hypothetical protein